MKVYWTDFHSNIHHEQMDELDKWISQVRDTMDFWPVAYYPYSMRKDENGFAAEDLIDYDLIKEDWEKLRAAADRMNASGFAMFMGYEWQGNGKDGDHNVFFKDNLEDPCFVRDYNELVKHYRQKEAIGIPHHTAYQPGNRGKNWDTTDERFSPFAEIYSSHGSSESDETWITMDRHVHMGPRTDVTAVSSALKKGVRTGIIASGDNHSCPGVYGFGYAAAIAGECTKEALWEAFRKRHVYGVSKDRILLDMHVNEAMMGDEVCEGDCTFILSAEGTDTIDRVEILLNEERAELIAGPKEIIPSEGKVVYRFFLEAGWGPDLKVFPDMTEKKWRGSLKTNGKILSVIPCFSTFGQKEIEKNDHEFTFEFCTHANSASGRWMGPSAVTTEGFVFEIEDDISSSVVLDIEGVHAEIPILKLLEGTSIYSLDQEVRDLLKDRFNFREYYRSDPFWHNAYKFRVHRASLKEWYTMEIKRSCTLKSGDEIRCRVIQKNGSAAWSSPVFVTAKPDEKEEMREISGVDNK